MKRAGLLFCADVDAPRFKLLKQRNQLPFAGPDREAEEGWANYTLDQAFQLRLMLDLIGGESSDKTQLNGLGPEYAANMVANAMCRFPRHPLNQIEPRDWWAGLVVLEEKDGDDNRYRFTEWYVGEIENLGAWLADARKRPCAGPNGSTIYRNLPVVRLFLANATRAANFVRDRARELGLPEGDDYSEVKPG